LVQSPEKLRRLTVLYAMINADGTFGGMTTDHDTAESAAKYENRCDWKDLAAAEVIAKAATEFHGVPYVATDAGDHCHPRYSVVQVPRVGDEVSYSFNGDTYPDGTVVSVSKTFKVVKTQHNTYYRQGTTGSWKHSGMWCLLNGHRKERNPHL
jgi:hypothetical protein